jgi:very-short-patch-repair endonuclease
MDVAAVINRLGGIATKAELAAFGISGFDLTAAVRRGQIRRVRRAHYATPAAPWDAVLAVRVGGRLAGISAAKSYGLWAGFDERLHIAVPANASRLRTTYAPSFSDEVTPDISDRETILHWTAPPVAASECWRVSAKDALLQVLDWADAETAIACLDSARTVLGWTDHDIHELFANEPARPRARAALSRPGSDSGPESVVRQRLLAAGIHVDQQVQIPDVGRVDMVVQGARVAIEVDSRTYHSDPESFENDRRRGAELLAIGYADIRLSFKQIFGDWPWCLAKVEGAITVFRNV